MCHHIELSCPDPALVFAANQSAAGSGRCCLTGFARSARDSICQQGFDGCRRDAAERAVAPVYAPPDPAIARTQATNITSILQSISLIRSDTNSSPEEKKNALIAIQGFTLPAGSDRFFAWPCPIPAGFWCGAKPSMCLWKQCATLSGLKTWILSARVLLHWSAFP